MQLKQAQTEFASLRQLQQTAAAYRHDSVTIWFFYKGLPPQG